MRYPMAERLAKLMRNRLIHSSTATICGGIWQVDGVTPALWAGGAAFRVQAVNGEQYEVKVTRYR